MRVAITAHNNQGLQSQVSHPVGRSPFFALIELEGETIQRLDLVANPYLEQHDPAAIARFLNSHGVELLISGGGGRHARPFFEAQAIARASGASGTLQDAISDYLAGKLGSDADGECGCGGHHHDHDNHGVHVHD